MKIYRIGQTLAALEQMPETGEGTLVLLTSEELANVPLCRDWRVLCITPRWPGTPEAARVSGGGAVCAEQ